MNNVPLVCAKKLAENRSGIGLGNTLHDQKWWEMVGNLFAESWEIVGNLVAES